MTSSAALPTPSFGALLRQLRRRAGLTQGELAIRVGYSVAQISRLEQNERLPTVAAVAEVFVPALELHAEPQVAHRLIELAALARGERPPTAVRITRTVRTAIEEQAVDAPGYLPATLITLVGRTSEVERVGKRLLAAPGRLLTLLGPPGVGKTQLSLAVAAQMRPHFRHGVWFVPLAPIDEPSVVAETIATTLGLPVTANRPATQRLLETLRRQEVLLVLDNVEQVTACTPLLVTLLQECAALRLLVTSTEPLRLRAEQRHKVPPLEPAAGVELFIQRAQAADPDFALTPTTIGAITELCLRLDGLPLAIELIAAHVDQLAPTDMLARLSAEQLDLLAHGPRDLEAHHRTLRAAIQRSYTLLTATEQALFRRLSVFVGGCDRDAVAHLGDDAPTLRALVRKSLLHSVANRTSAERFAYLETLRFFALERLAAHGEEASTRRLHAGYYLALATQASTHWQSPHHQQWLDRLEVEHDNLRAAMRWLLEHDGAGAQQLGAALREFWYIRGHFAEARRLLDQALLASSAPTPARGQALLAAARLAHAQDENTAGLRLIEACLPILRQSGDLAAYAEALRTGGWIAHSAGQSPRALAMFEEALDLSQTLDAQALTADLYISLAQVYALDGDAANFVTARRYFANGRRIAHALDRQESLAYALHGEASLEFMAGDYVAAQRLVQQALVIFQVLDFRRNVPLALLLSGEAALLAGDLETAHTHGQTALDHYTQLAIPWGVAAAHHLCGQAAYRSAQWTQAVAHLRTSLEMSWRLCDDKLTATNLAALGGVALAQAEAALAALLLAAAHRMLERLPPFLAPGYRIAYADMLTATRTALSAAEFALAWTAGEALPLAQVVATALASPVDAFHPEAPSSTPAKTLR